MAPRTLFDLILKVLGILFIRDILEAFSRSLSVLVYFPQYASQREAFFNMGVTLPPLILYSLFSWLLLFRTRNIISLLKIDRNFGEEEISFNLQRTSVLTIAVVVVGGWILVNAIPEFFRHAFYYYQERRMYVRMVRPDMSYMVMSAFKIILGLILIIWNNSIVKGIELVGTKKGKPGWPVKKSIRKEKAEDRKQ